MVTDKNVWGVSAERLVAKATKTGGSGTQEAAGVRSSRDLQHRREAQLRETGIYWDVLDVSALEQADTDRARFKFKASLSDLIWNAAALEGNAYTLPEVRTLLDGVTVGGKTIEDEAQILALRDAFAALDGLVATCAFALSKSVSDRLNGIVARHEAIESGHFRGEGSAQGGGAVKLSNGGSVDGLPHGDGGELLRDRFGGLVEHLSELEDPRERALVYFAAATRSQFYFDGNKRTARLMTAGLLMSSGFDAINIPHARRLEFNHALDVLFETDDASELLRFLVSCAN